MDLNDIFHLLSPSHTRAMENVYNSLTLENATNDQQLPETLMDYNIMQEIERKETIDLDDFKDILSDTWEFDGYPSNLSDRERNDNDGLVTETKALLDLNESKVVLEDYIRQDETDVQVQYRRKTDLFNNENVSFDNAGKIEMEITPFSIEQSVNDNKTESKTDIFKTSLPNFQDTFKMFINLPYNTSTQEKVRKHNVLQCDEVNAKQEHPNKENGLKIATINITDEEIDYDDISLVEDQTETYDSILANNVMFLDRAIDGNLARKLEAATEYDSDGSGYNSSDFEFISESEAELEGLIVNDTKSKRKNKKTKTYTVNSKDNDLDKKYSRRYKISKHVDERAKEHKIPEGEEYFNLFQGNNEPTLPMYYMMENKSLGASSCMAIEHEGIGFDMRKMERDDVDDDELKEDAKKSLMKILELYPFENCKRKRIH